MNECLQRLRSELDKADLKYEVVTHPVGYTAQHEAAALQQEESRNPLGTGQFARRLLRARSVHAQGCNCIGQQPGPVPRFAKSLESTGGPMSLVITTPPFCT